LINKNINISIKVQSEDFNQHLEYQTLRERDVSQGAIVTFTGLVRDNNLGKTVTGLFLEHYPGMTEVSLQQIAAHAVENWQLGGVSIVHRVGLLGINDQIVFVGVSAPHRQAAFTACHFIMDYLKTQAPFWKKEFTDNSSSWVKARQSDTDAAQKWQE
jgi:molybdopterin synthase catalytic subunit